MFMVNPHFRSADLEKSRIAAFFKRGAISPLQLLGLLTMISLFHPFSGNRCKDLLVLKN
jgi:hypothetical protein